MTMIHYRTKLEVHYHKHIGWYIAFGIRIYVRRRLMMYIPDAFCRRQQAEQFVNLCNIEQPEPIHLCDLIEDWL